MPRTCGGLSFFGAVGLVLGPVITAPFVTIMHLCGETSAEMLGEPRACSRDEGRAKRRDGPFDLPCQRVAGDPLLRVVPEEDELGGLRDVGGRRSPLEVPPMVRDHHWG